MAAEWFVGRIMEKTINDCYDYLKDRVRSETSLKKLERLRENLPKIQAVVYYANQAQISNQNTALNECVWHLRDAIDEAEDLLDEFEYFKHKEQLAKDTEETKKRKATSFIPENFQKILKIGKDVLKIDPNLKRLEEAVQKLDKASDEVGTFLHLLEGTKQEQQKQELEFYKIRETGSLPKNDLIGRGKDKEFLMQWLRKPSNEEHQALVNGTDLYRNISLLSVVGHGGMGKTTLLQHVYDDEMTKEFDLKIWVCVSNNFDVKKVITDMLESLTKKRPALESLDTLQRNLKSEVMSKKFLLVMDDIWDEESKKSKWEDVLAPLAHGGIGSRILVTTRMESVALTVAKVIKKKKEIHKLEGLAEYECLQLLNSHAFTGVENPKDYKKLRFIAKKMVKKLSGSPLSAKVIGGVLNDKLDEKHWTDILNGANSGQDSIFHILRLSYIFLPKYLQICFVFCSVFPQDNRFDKDDLVRMWIALGFIEPSHIQGETMEDIGGRYFDVLCKKSFFDKFEYPEYYKVHDLLHELAHNIFAQECLRVVGDEEFPLVNHKTLRHLSVRTTKLDVLRKIEKLKNLRSLFVFFDGDKKDLDNLLIEIFNASRSIRLLCISARNLEMIPEEIGSLIHLRYLKIEGRKVKMLPKNLSNLHHLQFIIYKDTWNYGSPVLDDFLPSDINNLFNLRYLNLRNFIFPPIHGIGKLKLLQRLPMSSLRNEDGYKIEELELMNDLHQLGIKGLENVNDVDEACSAKLFNKRNLTDLSLEWGRNQSRNRFNLDENVLDNLQPPESIKVLSIKNYMGTRSAKWMNDASLINNIEYIKLENCMQWQALPPFGQLPFLKYLKLVGMPKVKWLDNNFLGNDNCCAFPSLEVLHIYEFEELEYWFNTGSIAAEHGCLFPRLTQLELSNCPKLKELPSLPPKLGSLMIHNIGWKNLNCRGISSIEDLNVQCCRNITDIFLPNEIARLAALRYLTIQDCSNLISLGGHQEAEATEKCQLKLNNLTISDPSILLLEPLRSITFLRELYIITNNDLVSFPIEAEQWFLKIRSSLHQVHLSDLKALKSFHFSLESFSSLKQLEIYDVPQLQQLPKLPTSLEILSLCALESLQCIPSLSAVSSLRYLTLSNIPLLKSLPNLPPSLSMLKLGEFENLDPDFLLSCLPTLSSLKTLSINTVPSLRELPDLPQSLCDMFLSNLSNLVCLPSCLPTLSSLQSLSIINIPKLQELPDLPSSLKYLSIDNCDPEFMKRYRNGEGSNWHKIAHIRHVYIPTN